MIVLLSLVGRTCAKKKLFLEPPLTHVWRGREKSDVDGLRSVGGAGQTDAAKCQRAGTPDAGCASAEAEGQRWPGSTAQPELGAQAPRRPARSLAQSGRQGTRRPGGFVGAPHHWRSLLLPFSPPDQAPGFARHGCSADRQQGVNISCPFLKEYRRETNRSGGGMGRGNRSDRRVSAVGARTTLGPERSRARARAAQARPERNGRSPVRQRRPERPFL